MKCIATACLALFSYSASAQDQSGSLSLICGGGGSANQTTHSMAQGWDSNGDYASATVQGSRAVAFADEVRVKIAGSEGRLRVPHSMLPSIRMGGENGWYKLKNIKFSDAEITASVSLNPLNNPKVRIDRYTGGISISGKGGDYTGRCQVAPDEPAQRQF